MSLGDYMYALADLWISFSSRLEPSCSFVWSDSLIKLQTSSCFPSLHHPLSVCAWGAHSDWWKVGQIHDCSGKNKSFLFPTFKYLCSIIWGPCLCVTPVPVLWVSYFVLIASGLLFGEKSEEYFYGLESAEDFFSRGPIIFFHAADDW